MMVKNVEIIKITKKITSISNYLFKLELDNKKDIEYYNCLDILKELLEKENLLYSELEEKDIIILEMYSGYERKSFDDIFDDSLDNFEKGNSLINKTIMKERIKERLSVYQYVSLFNDKNWYNNIYKGVYLGKSDLDENKELFDYVLIQSLYTTLSYINVINNLNESNVKLVWKYLFIYIEPFIEKYVINNNFKISNDTEYTIKFSSVVNNSDEYKMAASQVFDVYLSENCGEILNDKFRRVNDFFLSIINEESKEKIIRFSNDTLMNMGYPDSICIDMYFNLFDECQYVKKKV